MVGEVKMKVLDIFYENIIKEASKGKINSHFCYNIIFSTFLKEEGIKYEASSKFEDVMIPTVYIKRKKDFDELLVKYVEKCLDFYDDSNFVEEVSSGRLYDEVDRISKEKTILAFLFANAVFEDFSDPISFLRKRINFFENTEPCKYDLGYSNILESQLEVEISKDKLNNETPYKFTACCISRDGEKYELPELKFGVSDGRAYVYAIQNANKVDTSFAKKINRKLYKIGEGFSKEEDNYEIYEEGNLNDVTPSFVLVANLFVSYMNKVGVNDFSLSSFLLERWNAKVISNKVKDEMGIRSYEESYAEQLKIQANLTEKFLRTFLRLDHHCDNLSITSYPMEQTSYLCLTNDGIIRGNNSLLNETAYMMSMASKVNVSKNGKNK